MLTRSEILFTCRNAARGAGYDWGMSGEAARATLKLLDAGEDGFAALIELLSAAQGQSHPMNIADESPICGLSLGVYLADCGECPETLPKDVIAPLILRACIEDMPKGAARPDHFPREILDFAKQALVPESELSQRHGAGEG